MKTLNVSEQREIKGGFKSTRYCCNYASGNCLKGHSSALWKNGKGSFSWVSPVTWYVKYNALTPDYYACHAYDVDNY